MNTLDDWLSLLEKRHFKSIDLGLERIRRVAQRLDLLRVSCAVITVAGTNGKGSTVATIEQLALQHGLRVGCYTSPHLLHFNERIRVNGQNILDAELLPLFAAIECQLGDDSLSYFEFTTLAALLHFKRQTLDLVVLEVGMGGRLDAVNIIDTDVAVITSIALDHIAFLGHTETAIAAEKAGICRHDKPLVISDAAQIPLISAATAPYSPIIYAAQQSFVLTKKNQTWCWAFQALNIVLPESKLAMDLVAGALMAFVLAKPGIWDPLAVQRAVQNAALKGRWQCIGLQPERRVDVAHNPQAAQRLAERCANNITGRLHLVSGMLNDKDQSGSLAAFVSLPVHWHLTDLPGERGSSALDLRMKLPHNPTHKIDCYPDVVQAWRSACALAETNDMIVAWGSFLTVAAILAIIEQESN